MSRHGPVGLAIVGAGVISEQYLTTLSGAPDVRVHAVTDLRPEVAAQRAQQFAIAGHGPVSVALDHPEVELVVNLTVPAAHLEVGLAAIEAGRHVWNEKPLAVGPGQAETLLGAADEAGLRVGAAPDTILGPGWQEALTRVTSGAVGRPLSATFRMQSPGAQTWHPNPDFLFAPGAGPLFDLGPYYLTALVQVLGPVAEVAALGSRAEDQRVIATGPRAGETFDVQVPTHVEILLRFAGGATASGVLSVDSPHARASVMEITGTEGIMALPDPNKFHWDEGGIPQAKARRGTGVVEMARALRSGTPHRASGELAFHVLEVMCAIEASITSGSFVPIRTRVEPAATLPEGWDPHAATL
jgi:predicted dehydrogenase